MDEPRTVYITQGYGILDEVEFTLVVKGQVVRTMRTGDQGVTPPRDINYRLPALKVAVPPGASTLYVKVRSAGTIIFKLTTYSEEAFQRNHVFEYMFVASIVCILLTMALYNFFIYIQLRKVVYLIYVAFILCFALQPLGFAGFFTEWFPQLPFLSNEGYLLVSDLTALFAFLFPVYFLSLRNYQPWLYRLCMAGVALSVIACLVVLVNYNLGAKVSVLLTTMASFVTLTCGLVCAFKRFRPAYFFTAAWLLMIVANLIRNASLVGAAPSYFIVEWGTLIGCAAEVVLISLALADKVRITERLAVQEIETLNRNLQDEHAKVVALNENLEDRVEEQTREVKSILRHIHMGILVVQGDDQAITPTYSASITDIFQTRHVEGRNIVDFLFQGASASNELQSQVRSVLESSLGEHELNVDINMHLLPRELECQFGHEHRLLELDWNPVVNDGLVEKMMVTVKDVTVIRKLEREAAEKSKELEYIGEILDVAPAKFDRFMDASQRFLADNERLIRANHKYNDEVLKILFINLHTIKGTARALALRNLTPLVHNAEQNLSAIMKKEKVWNQRKLLDELAEVKSLFDKYLVLNQDKLGRATGNHLAISVDYAEYLLRFFDQLDLKAPMDLKLTARTLRTTIEDLIFVRAESVFSEVLANTEMLARDLGKEPPKVAVRDGGILLSRKGQELIRNSFIHIVRNSMDHGIETAAERSASGKPAAGNIEVSIDVADRQLRIFYKDDGRGLNLTAIRKLAIERGLIKPTDDLSSLELSYLIFESGLSTCNQLSEISGRGMGMNAVREYMETQKGIVHIRLLNCERKGDEEYQHFMFEFDLSEECYIKKSA